MRYSGLQTLPKGSSDSKVLINFNQAKVHIIGGQKLMLIVQVHVHVKSEYSNEFIEATSINAKNSIKEPGIARFDIIQQQDNPYRFILVEVYRTAADPAKHKETAHYATWRDTVADMMAEPRSSVKYMNIYPEDSGW